MLLDIVILPPKALREKIGKKLRKAVSGLEVDYLVDNVELIPHLTLFHLKTDSGGYKNTAAFVKRLVSSNKRFYVRGGRFESPKNGYLWYRFALSPRLLALQAEVRNHCLILRTGVLPVRSSKKLDPLARRLRRKYGTQYLFERSAPHFTMAQMRSSSDARKVIARMPKGMINFKAEKLAIAEINLNGQVTKILKTFKLTK